MQTTPFALSCGTVVQESRFLLIWAVVANRWNGKRGWVFTMAAHQRKGVDLESHYSTPKPIQVRWDTRRLNALMPLDILLNLHSMMDGVINNVCQTFTTITMESARRERLLQSGLGILGRWLWGGAQVGRSAPTEPRHEGPTSTSTLEINSNTRQQHETWLVDWLRRRQAYKSWWGKKVLCRLFSQKIDSPLDQLPEQSAKYLVFAHCHDSYMHAPILRLETRFYPNIPHCWCPDESSFAGARVKLTRPELTIIVTL